LIEACDTRTEIFDFFGDQIKNIPAGIEFQSQSQAGLGNLQRLSGLIKKKLEMVKWQSILNGRNEITNNFKNFILEIFALSDSIFSVALAFYFKF
jgi:hypothetical protein